MSCAFFSLLESSLKMVILKSQRDPNWVPLFSSSWPLAQINRQSTSPPGRALGRPLPLSSCTLLFPLTFCSPQGSLSQLFPLSSLWSWEGGFRTDDILRSFKRNWLQSKFVKLAASQPHLLIFFKQIFYFQIILDLQKSCKIIQNSHIPFTPFLLHECLR